MSRNISREEALLQAAEKIRKQKEKEAQEDQAFYERITSGVQWLAFKIVVAVCLLILVVTTVDRFSDGETKKLTQNDWHVDRDWEWTWHKVLDVQGAMFAPELSNWSDRDETTMELIYSPILHTPKKLTYDLKKDGIVIRNHVEYRQHSFFSWFPELQIFLLIPLFTFLFKRQKPWFNFARIFSMFVILPGALLVVYFALT
ncbi:MAG: hypothetical protein N4A41_07265 [Crocinitomicaceae bacterium]|jgi:hypothetical protein|nr:hypothetical protein [Crocinitomicaceae bacterium]